MRRLTLASVVLLLGSSCAEVVVDVDDDRRGDTNVTADDTATTDTGIAETDTAPVGDVVDRPDAETDTGGEADADTGPETDTTVDTDTGSETDTDEDPDVVEAFCGDGIVQDGEECDNGTSNADDEPNACRTDCREAHCGDGMIDTGEDCDDGDDVDDNACSNTCVPVTTALCAPCDDDSSRCGRAIDRCVALPGGSFCAMACNLDADTCPEGYSCQSPDDGGSAQCLPTSGVCSDCYDPDGDGYGLGDGCADLDCAPSDPDAHPGATEVCNGIDDNCDGTVDEGFSYTTYTADADGDGHGAVGGESREACEPPAGFVESADDCDDGNNAAYPGAAEVCDGVDNNCDTAIDEGLPIAPYYVDGDGDGHGAEGVAGQGCAIPAGHVASNDDCDDTQGNTYPGAPEVCDTRDNDCDVEVDEGVLLTYWPDGDGDGHGDPGGETVTGCTPPAGHVDNNTDCDDSASAEYPGASEVCDGYDNDCDDAIDEGGVCPYEVFTRDGVAYMVGLRVKPWTSAAAACEESGYTLVTIDDAAENAYVQSLVQNHTGGCDRSCSWDDDGDCDDGGPSHNFSVCDYASDCADCGSRGAFPEFWIGYSDRGTEGTWVWDALTSSYTNWGSGEPNDSGGEDCAELRTSTGLWNDTECDDDLLWVCEGPH